MYIDKLKPDHLYIKETTEDLELTLVVLHI